MKKEKKNNAKTKTENKQKTSEVITYIVQKMEG
jgi:hypothetical protein